MPANSPSQRQLRVAETIRHALVSFLQKTAFLDPALDNKYISIREVAINSDLKIADIYINALVASPKPLSDQAKNTTLKALNQNSKKIRHALATRLQLKNMPALRFHWDNTLDNAQKMEELIAKALKT